MDTKGRTSASAGAGSGTTPADERKARIAAAKTKIETLKGQIAAARAKLSDGSLADVASEGSADARKIGALPKRRQTMQGHYGKVYAVDWGSSSTDVVSASQDGKLILWSAATASKKHMIPLRTAWVMTCAMDRAANQFAAVGGLDDMCSVYSLQPGSINRVLHELAGHSGYVSSAKYMGGDDRIATSSGDGTLGVWDVNTGTRTGEYLGHSADVMSVSVNPGDHNMLASGGCDSVCKIWDVRTGKCTHTFEGHESDVNAVHFMGGGCVSTGSDDSSGRLFDLRSYACLNEFRHMQFVGSVTSVTASRSGRLVFQGADNASIFVYDTLAAEGAPPVHKLRGHGMRVSAVTVSPDGLALASASWDCTLGIFA